VENPLKILEIVENKEYFNTNSAFSARELIPSSASLCFRVVSPYEGQGLPTKFGWFVVSYTYAFASQHIPGEDLHADIQSAQWLNWKMK